MNVLEENILSNREWDQQNQVASEFEQCCRNYEQQSFQVKQLREQAEPAQRLFTRQLQTYLSSRQDLPSLDSMARLNIIKRLEEIPNLFNIRIMNVWKLVVSRVEQASWILLPARFPTLLSESSGEYII